MVSAISSYGTYGIGSMSAFSPLAQTQKVDPIIAQEIRDASEVAKTAKSTSQKVEAVRPNAKNDGTWAYVQSQNIGLPQAMDIEGFESEGKIVIDLKGYTIPESDVFLAPDKAQEEIYKNAEEEAIVDVAQEYMSKFAETLDENAQAVQVNNNYEKRNEKIDNFYQNQVFGLNSYAQSAKMYENYTHNTSSFVA